MALMGQRGIACVKGEIHNVLATMDASISSFRSGFFDILSETSDLSVYIRTLQDLHEQLGFYSQLASIESTAFFRPFLAVIESQDIPWQARTAALQSVHKFLLYELVVPQSLSASDTMNECAAALVAATSKASVHRSSRELLQLRALELFLELVRCSAGVLISDDSLCLAFEQMIALRVHPNASQLLAAYAEDILGQFVLVIFARVRLRNSPEEAWSPSCHNHFLRPDSTPGKNSTGYGPSALVRILRFIANLIDPAHNDLVVRLLGLRLINMCLETAGTALGKHQALVAVVQDDICKQILQNSQTDDSSVLTLILRIVFDLFATLRKHIRVQLEVFFTSIHIRIASNPSAPINQRRLILQSIVEICHEPNLLIGLYRNYDCEIASTNMFEDLIRLLNRLSLPEGSALTPRNSVRNSPSSSFQSHIHLLALQSLLAVISSIAQRFSNMLQQDDDETLNDKSDCDGDRLSSNLRAKADLKRAATLFNECGYKAVGQIQNMGLVEASSSPELSVDPKSMAKFLLEAPGLDKRQVGAYLGRDDKTCIAVLDAYLGFFEMHGLGFVQGLRTFMESFIIPGEAQMISRIMEQFAKRYFSQNNMGPIADEDAAFVLAFSVIMLNTDAHNPGVKAKMSFEQFSKNNRGINKGADFPEDYLQSIYDEIVQNEIRIVSASIEDLVDRSGHGAVNSAHWEQLVRQSRQAEMASFRVSLDHSHGKAMFKMVQANFAHLITYYLGSISEAKLTEKLIEGCHLFSRICIIYNMRDPFNGLIISLCRDMIQSLKEIYNSSRGSVKVVFGKARRTHRCLQLIFKLVLSYGPRCLCEGWMNVIHMILWLRQMDLLPHSLCHMEDIRDSDGKPLPSYQAASLSVIPKQRQSLAASIFTSLWTESSDDDEVDDNDDIVSNDLITVQDHESDHISVGLEAVRSCVIEQVFFVCHTSTTTFNESLRHLVQTLILLSSNTVSQSVLPVGPLENFDSDVLNESSAVFCLERLSNIVENNAEQLVQSGLWNLILEHLRQILTSFPDRSSLFIERAVVNLLRLSVAGHEAIASDAVRLLPCLLNLPVNIHAALCDRLAFGLSLFLRTRTVPMSDAVFSNVCEILASTRAHPKAFVVIMDTLEFLCRKSCMPSELMGMLHVVSSVIEAPGPYVKPSTGVALLFTIHRSIQKLCKSSCNPDSVALKDDCVTNESLNNLWMTSISCLCRACYSSTDYSAQVYAVDCLTMCLISDECRFQADLWINCFEQLLLPLIKSETDTDIVVRIANMVFKILLYRLPVMVTRTRFSLFWSRYLLGIISGVLRDGHNEIILVHFKELLRNAILVITHIDLPQESSIEKNELVSLVLDCLHENQDLVVFCDTIREELSQTLATEPNCSQSQQGMKMISPTLCSLDENGTEKT